MRHITAQQIKAVLDYPALIGAVGDSFKGKFSLADRAHYVIPRPGGTEATLLLMPAWTESGYLGVKSATIFPDNTRCSLPSVMATYLLMDASTGEPLAVMDGKEITVMRTAASSALASGFLSRRNAASILIVGAGSMCIPLAQAHCSVRGITSIKIWNRNSEKSALKVAQLTDLGLPASISTNLESDCGQSDIVSCATLSRAPLILRDWLMPGVHIDLVGAYTPAMRESDSAVIARAIVFVDTMAGAQSDAGDLIHAQTDGVFNFSDIASDLSGLVRGNHPGRISEDEITLFKSVGAACEDLAAAVLVYERLN